MRLISHIVSEAHPLFLTPNLSIFPAVQPGAGQVLRMFLLGTEKEAVKRSLPLNRQPAGVEILTFRQRERGREGRRPQGELGSP